MPIACHFYLRQSTHLVRSDKGQEISLYNSLTLREWIIFLPDKFLSSLYSQPCRLLLHGWNIKQTSMTMLRAYMCHTNIMSTMSIQMQSEIMIQFYVAEVFFQLL